MLGTKDKNPSDTTFMYYRLIKKILELNYTDFKVIIFYYDQIKVEDKSNGCKHYPG